MKHTYGYYDIGTEPIQADRALENQRHLNRAYLAYRQFMAEILQVTEVDNGLARVQRTMYTTEDTLRDYVAQIPKAKEAV